MLKALAEMDIGLVDPYAVDKYGHTAADWFENCYSERYEPGDAKGDRVREQFKKLMHIQRRRWAQSTGTANEHEFDYRSEEREGEYDNDDNGSEAEVVGGERDAEEEESFFDAQEIWES